MSEKPPLTRANPSSRPGILSFVYGIYALLAFLPILLSAIFGALLIPGLDRRRRWVSAVSGIFFRVAGIPVRLTGLQNLPDGHCVVVANHASHLDGLALQAFLPPRFSFVIKGEMRNVPGVHYLLRRIGSRFVERFVASASARDARKLLRASSNGESFAFFPEGTFVAEAGLRRFRPGAFATAIKGELPIVPVVICGARRILPAGSLLARRGNLNIEILPLIPPTDAAFEGSKELSAEARQRMLQVLDEPDLHTPGHTPAPE
jgi:1-acyl-sn-glycerol-3-phosphate acyltransferase